MRNAFQKKNVRMRIAAVLLGCAVLLCACSAAAEGRPASSAEKTQTLAELMVFETEAARFQFEYESYNNVTREDGVTLWPVEVPDDNPFVYVTAEEAIQLAEEGTGVLFIGSGWCRVCRMLAVLLSDAAGSSEAPGKEYLQQIYYLNPDMVDPDDAAYPELCEKVLTPLHQYMAAKDQAYTNVYGAPGLMEKKATMTEEEAGDLGNYKYTVSYWYKGKLLGMHVGTTSHFVNSDTPPTEEDNAEFTQRFYEIVRLFGTDLCDYC